VDAEAGLEFAKPAAHHHKAHHKAKVVPKKLSDAPADHASRHGKRRSQKKLAKSASLLRSEPAMDSETDVEAAQDELREAQEVETQQQSGGSSEAETDATETKADASATEGTEASADASEAMDMSEGALTDSLGTRTLEGANATATVLAFDVPAVLASDVTAGSANLSMSASDLVAAENADSSNQGSEAAEDMTNDLDLAADTASLEEGMADAESDEELNRGAAQACVGTMIEKCPTDKTDPCKTKDAGSCINVFHKCTSDKMTQCAVRKGKCATGGATCYLPCTGVELHGSACAALPVDNCNGGYVSDGSSGMSCMISTADITKCTSAGTCALPTK